MSCEDKTVFNINGGQVNIAKYKGIINAVQNNGASVDELEDIINGIIDNISDINKEEQETLLDAIDMIKEEFAKGEPKMSRLRSCVTLLAPMVTILNGVPGLAEKIGTLINFITQYIK